MTLCLDVDVHDLPAHFVDDFTKAMCATLGCHPDDLIVTVRPARGP